MTSTERISRGRVQLAPKANHLKKRKWVHFVFCFFVWYSRFIFYWFIKCMFEYSSSLFWFDLWTECLVDLCVGDVEKISVTWNWQKCTNPSLPFFSIDLRIYILHIWKRRVILIIDLVCEMINSGDNLLLIFSHELKGVHLSFEKHSKTSGKSVLLSDVQKPKNFLFTKDRKRAFSNICIGWLM
jgi:hypothetical protein